jgi:hypothetical protein
MKVGDWVMRDFLHELEDSDMLAKENLSSSQSDHQEESWSRIRL